MMSRETMKLALEALIAAYQGKDKTGQVTEAITALREALAEQPAQHRAWFTVDELSAWADKKLKENPQWAEQPAQVDPCIDGSCSCCWAHFDEQPAQQEPVAWRDPKNVDPGQGCTYDKAKHEKWPHIYTQPLYTSPRRTWVGLTHEDTYEATGTASTDLLDLAKLWSDNKIHVYQFDNEARKIIESVVRRASAKLREKNSIKENT